MSPRRRRRRIRGGAEAGAEVAATPQPAAPALPEWKWRTMPVFIALSFGLFVGLLLGISVSRFVMRLLMQRGIIKPQARRR